MTRPLEVDDTEVRLASRDAHARSNVAARQIGELRAALTMLTRLPVGTQPGEVTGARAFALAGALVGLAGFVPLVLLGMAVPPVAAILAVAAMAILSGGLHLDGLADTADALVAVGRGAAERARKDPSIGAGGAAALILVVALQVTSLTLLATGPGPLVAGFVCVGAGAGSRIVPVVLAGFARSRATGDGLGAWFVRQTTSADAAIAVMTGALLAIAAGFAVATPALPIAGLVGCIVGVGLGLGMVRARGQLDGDGLGASVELGFASIVLVAAVLVGRSSA